MEIAEQHGLGVKRPGVAVHELLAHSWHRRQISSTHHGALIINCELSIPYADQTVISGLCAIYPCCEHDLKSTGSKYRSGSVGPIAVISVSQRIGCMISEMLS